MYAKGMTTNDIESHIRELYDIEISDSTISRITDKILPLVKEWQERPLEEIYAVYIAILPVVYGTKSICRCGVASSIWR